MGFGIIIVVLAVFLISVLRLGRSLISTRRMSGQGQWPADGEIGGIEPGGDFGGGQHG